ncbi:MAG: outer membrane lipid asymmetry maintenance protein MlaD [Paracoccaceae bacterium]|jgi:phospholipid/cholesterol/gamma-HCH transport system substrate-binding protein
MAENPTEVVAGGAVLAVAVAFLAFVGQSTGYGASSDSYPLKASFRSADGITLGSDVRMAGVKIGAITAIELNPESFFADATLSLSKTVQLPDDSAVMISSEGLLGGNFVEIIPGGSVAILEAGAEIEDTQGSVSLITLLMKFVGGDGK